MNMSEFARRQAALQHSYVQSGSIKVAQTPLPAAAPMLASALGLGGFIGWRLKRAQRQAAAA